MNINNGGLGFAQTLNNEDFKRKLKESMQEVNNFSTKSYASMDHLQIKASDLAKGIGLAFTASTATSFIQEMVKVRGEFEQLEIAFTTMLGSKERADKLMMEIVDFAAKTPFGLQSTSEATKMLLAYGESADTALDTMRKLGDIASGVGIPLKDIAYLYGTTMTQGRLYTQDLNQFLGRGIPMMDELAKIFGVSKNEVKGLVEAGKVGFPEVQKVIDNLTASGSMFGGLMEAQSKSISGQIEQLKDAFDVMLNDIGKDSEGFVKSVIGSASTVVENYDKIGASLTTLIATYGAYKAAVITVSLANTSFISSMDKIERYGNVGAKRLAVSYNQAKATLEEAKAQEKLSVTQLKTARSSKELADAAHKKSLVDLNSSHALKKAADEEVAVAQRKYDSYKGSHWVQKEKQALTDLEIAKEKQLTAATNIQTASVNANTTSERANVANRNLSTAAVARNSASRTVATATTNLETVATTRLTFAQRMNVAWTELATIATTAWNASLLSNPIVLVVAAIAGLTTAYFLLRDTTTEAEKAQEAYNETQNKVKEGIDETKKKAEEYINVLKDETATVYQQIQAYKALQELKLKGLENLTQEEIKLMDISELKKKINSASDENNLSAQKSELKRLEEEIKSKEQRLQSLRQGSAKDQYDASKLADNLKVITSQYNLQYDTVRKMEDEMQIANMTLDQKKAYWENIVTSTQLQLSEINKVKQQQNETKTILGVNLGLVNQTGNAFQMWNVSPLISQLEQAKTELSIINQSVGAESSTNKNKGFWEQQKKEASDARDALAYTQKGSKEWNELTKKINEANSALQAYNDSYTKPKTVKPTKPKKTKKSDDPLEIFKKEINQYKEEYNRAAKYLDSKDIGLLTGGRILQETLKSKGETYLDFLQKQAEQLRKSADTSSFARKQLIIIHDEIQQLLNDSQTDEFKKNLDRDLQSAETLLERIELINKLKNELAGKTDQMSLDKLKFLDEKDLQNQFDISDFLKNEASKFDEQYNSLEKLRKEHDAEMILLQDQYNKASNDSERRRISDLMNIRNAEYFNQTNGKTGNTEVDSLIQENRDLAQKRIDIEEKAQNEIATIRSQINSSTSAEQLKVFTDVITEIERKQKEALQSLDSEILKKSKGWVLVFADYSRKSSKEISSIIKQIQGQLTNTSLTSSMSPEDIKALQDRLKELKDYLSKNDPFTSLGTSVQGMMEKFKETGKIDFEDVKSIVNDLKGVVDETLKMADELGIEISESTASAIQLGTELLDAGMQIAEGIASKNPIQIVQGVVSAIGSIIRAGDRKKERQIQRYKEAINQLTKAFQELEYASSKALGGDSYAMQKQMMDNLIKQQAEYQKMIDAERKKKKNDKDKIAEWEQAMLDAKKRIQDIMESLVQDILQTNSQDLANELGNALAEAFGKGEDAAKSFEKVANNVLKNAILNQLKKQFLEKQLQGALDKLYADMGGDADGNFNWNGLTPEEQQAFKDKIKEISDNFTGMLEGYSDIFKDIIDPNQDSLSGAVKGVSEETASLIAGQMNAIRIMQLESLEVHRNSNAILVQQLDQLFRIEFNTRNIVPSLDKILTALTTNSTRAWGI